MMCGPEGAIQSLTATRNGLDWSHLERDAAGSWCSASTSPAAVITRTQAPSMGCDTPSSIVRCPAVAGRSPANPRGKVR